MNELPERTNVSEKAKEIGRNVYKRVVLRLLEDRDERIAQLEAELASRTETLDAIEDGKIAEYWRTCFYHQQDLQRELEAELAEAEQNRIDLCVMLKEWQALTHPARLSQINEETINLLEKNKGGSDALKEGR